MKSGSRLRVAVDAHALGTQAGGNETYMKELLISLRDYAPQVDVVALMNAGASAADLQGIARRDLREASSYLRVPVLLPWAAWRSGAQLLHVQYNAPPWSPCPFVVSVHDVGWERYPEYFRPALRKRLQALTGDTVRRARRVFALTQAMRAEIADTYDISPDKIDVVAPGVAANFRPALSESEFNALQKKYALPERYVLYVGALQPRKNLVRLAQAMAQLRGNSDALVLAGAGGWKADDILTEINAVGLGDRLILTGYVTDEDLPGLIAHARAVAYVSVYEGFGLPVLEALACGAPVVASAIPAIQEVAGPAVQYCDPLDVDSIAAALSAVLDDPATASRLREMGPARAALFTRQQMGEAAATSYARALH